jgi:predicted MFS family arabinose efflux permease
MCLLAGALGALVPYVLRDRFGRAWPIAISILVTLCCLIVLARPVSAIGFGVAAASFMFAWIAFFPYLMGVCSAFDPVGRLGALSLATQNIGFAAGPAIAGVLAERAGYVPLIGAAAVGYAIAAVALLAAIWHYRVLVRSGRQASSAVCANPLSG